MAYFLIETAFPMENFHDFDLFFVVIQLFLEFFISSIKLSTMMIFIKGFYSDRNKFIVIKNAHKNTFANYCWTIKHWLEQKVSLWTFFWNRLRCQLLAVSHKILMFTTNRIVLLSIRSTLQLFPWICNSFNKTFKMSCMFFSLCT